MRSEGKNLLTPYSLFRFLILGKQLFYRLKNHPELVGKLGTDPYFESLGPKKRINYGVPGIFLV
jgi:hypothetical protein